MDGRTLILIPALLLPALLAGCVDEPLHIAYRVHDGRTETMGGARTIDGTILVERNATLILDHADLVVGQALIVEGRVASVGSTITFAGPYARHEMDVRGSTDLAETTMRGGLQRFSVEGAATVRGGAVEAACVDVAGALDSRGASWTLSPNSCPWAGYGNVGLRVQGDAAFENGTIRAPVRLDAGTLRLGNLTLDASRGSGALLDVHGGDARAWGATFRAADLAQAVRVDGGRLRLVDSPLPRNAQLPSVGGSGRLEVLWTLTVRAESLVGQAPVAGANVTLARADDPAEGRAVTDARGEARVLALEYAYDGRWAQSRSGNPHAVTVEAKGQRGAAPAVVVEAPATVTVPVLPAPVPSLPALGYY